MYFSVPGFALQSDTIVQTPVIITRGWQTFNPLTHYLLFIIVGLDARTKFEYVIAPCLLQVLAASDFQINQSN